MKNQAIGVASSWRAKQNEPTVPLNIEARQAMIDAGLEPFDVMTPLGDILIDEKDLYDTDKEDLSSEQLVEKILKTHPVPPVNVNSGGSEQSDEEGDEAGNGSGTPNPDSGDEAGDQDGGDSGDENDSNGEHEGESGKGGSESDEHGESPSPDGSGGGATTGEFGGGDRDGAPRESHSVAGALREDRGATALGWPDRGPRR